MDTLTHALSGALLARATAPHREDAQTLPAGRRMFVGFVAAAFPDIDFITGYLSPLSYVYNHRGVTHSLVLLPLWAVLLSLFFALLWRWKPGWRSYFGVAAMGIGAHIAGDVITSFGTMIFAPLSDARYALSTTFIIDLWFTGIILLGLAASALWRSSRTPALAGLAVLAGYVGFQAVLQQRAIEFGEQYAQARGIRGATVTAMPRPVSPFNWTVFVREDERFHYAHVNLVRTEPRPREAVGGFVARLDAPYRPLSQAQWLSAGRYGDRPDEQALAREAYSQPAFAFFRWFAAYPALLDLRAGNPEDCAWFHDLRFVTPGRDSTPFLYGMCRGPDSAWQPFQLTTGGAKRPVY